MPKGKPLESGKLGNHYADNPVRQPPIGGSGTSTKTIETIDLGNMNFRLAKAFYNVLTVNKTNPEVIAMSATRLGLSIEQMLSAVLTEAALEILNESNPK